MPLVQTAAYTVCCQCVPERCKPVQPARAALQAQMQRAALTAALTVRAHNRDVPDADTIKPAQFRQGVLGAVLQKGRKVWRWLTDESSRPGRQARRRLEKLWAVLDGGAPAVGLAFELPGRDPIESFTDVAEAYKAMRPPDDAAARKAGKAHAQRQRAGGPAGHADTAQPGLAGTGQSAAASCALHWRCASICSGAVWRRRHGSWRCGRAARQSHQLTCVTGLLAALQRTSASCQSL